MKHAFLAGGPALLALVLLALISVPARADEVTCEGALAAVTVDNVRVPPDAACSLTGTTVLGTLKVESGAVLTAWQVTVVGNVQAEGAQRVRVLAGSVISGSVQIKLGGAAQVDLSHVNGDIQYDANLQPLSVTRSQVGGSVQVFQSTGGVTLAGNTIDGNLQCKENFPPPSGADNVVQGNREDQCALLAPLETTPPETAIVAGPPASTAAAEGVFDLSGSDDATPAALLLFECALDGAAFAACPSPHAVPGLTVGEHQLQVRALDLALNFDATPASHLWTVVAPPEATIDAGPAATTTSTAATFVFSAQVPGLTFECSLDGAGFAACASPVTYAALAMGDHTFRVRAVAPAASPNPLGTSYSWTVAVPSGFAVYLPAVRKPAVGAAAPAGVRPLARPYR